MRTRLIVVGTLFALLQACSSDTGSSSPDNNTAGSAGSGGSAGSAGSAGSSGSAGSAGSAGSSGASGSSGSAGSAGSALEGFEPSEQFTQLLEELEKLRNGERADLDGDGVTESQRVAENDGGFNITSDPDKDGRADFRVVSDGKGLFTTYVDADSDGHPEIVIERTVTQTSDKVVRVDDENFDGTMDRRRTWETLAANIEVQSFIDERDPNGDGVYEESQSLTLSKTKNAGDCDGSDNFPHADESSSVVLVPGSISMRTGAGVNGACWAADAQSVAKAVDCAMTRGAQCLSRTNTRQFNNLMAASVGVNVMPLQLGCGNNCSGTIASTRSFGRPWFKDSTMNINPIEWGKLDAEGQCNIMLHELLHWAGDDGSADHNDKSGAGSDDVYSCGRYCGGCSNAGHGSPNNSAVDCARCADTPKRKEACGVKKEYVELPCGGALTGVCHAGLACISGNCESCGGYKVETCDGSVVHGEATCCASCPSNCNKSNDVACNGSQSSSDTCTSSTPPFCK